MSNQNKVMKKWLSTQGHWNLWAERWEHAAFRQAQIRAFKRGVKFARTGK